MSVAQMTKPVPAVKAPIMQVADMILRSGCGEREGQRLLSAALAMNALERSRGNIVHAAHALGLHRNSLTRKLVLLGLSRLPGDIRRFHKQQRVLPLRRAR